MFQRRLFSSASVEIFDTKAKTLQRLCILSRNDAISRTTMQSTDYLKRYTASRLIERLAMDIKIPRYERVLEIGGGVSLIEQWMAGQASLMKRRESGQELFEQSDEHPDMPRLLVDQMPVIGEWHQVDCLEEAFYKNLSTKNLSLPFTVHQHQVKETTLPVLPDSQLESYDGILINLSLHYTNPLPLALHLYSHLLKPNGLLLGVTMGTNTLRELRTSLQVAEQERRGGFAIHVSPFMGGADMAALLQEADFRLSTIDQDALIVRYPSMIQLTDDLKWMGESNAVAARPTFLGRDTFLAASSIYSTLFGDAERTIPATFEFIFFIAWKADPNQAQPKRRGSAQHSMKEALSDRKS